MTFFLWVILIGTFLNLLIAIRFYYVIRNAPAVELPVEEQQDAVVILSVRGSDPTLEKTISGLLKQNFRDYRVLAVVDSPEDPAWKTLQRIKFESDVENRLTIQPMDPPRLTCSLKCSAIAGAVEGLPVSTQWVAFVDADVEVYPNWLADLLGPLMDPRVCVSTGNQWFEPPSINSAGSMIRSIWNAGAIVPSVLLSHPWAGSMGVRYEDVIVSSLIDDWKTSIVDDGPMMEFAAQMNGRIVVNPKLLMVNREDCSRAFVVDWMSRMLTWSRIFESTFWITVVHASISGGLVIVLALWILGSLLTFDLWSLGSSRFDVGRWSGDVDRWLLGGSQRRFGKPKSSAASDAGKESSENARGFFENWVVDGPGFTSLSLRLYQGSAASQYFLARY